MDTVDWDRLLPEVVDTVTSILESTVLTCLSLVKTIGLPISVFASFEHLQHLNLQLEAKQDWITSALTCPVSNCQSKSWLISLKLRGSDYVDGFSGEDAFLTFPICTALSFNWEALTSR